MFRAGNKIFASPYKICLNMRKENNQIYFVWNSKPAFSLDIIKCLIAYNQDGVCSLRGTNYIIFSLKIN